MSQRSVVLLRPGLAAMLARRQTAASVVRVIIEVQGAVFQHHCTVGPATRLPRCSAVEEARAKCRVAI
eukprot:9881507-Lingulodinium_polyedra.AAC.1